MVGEPTARHSFDLACRDMNLNLPNGYFEILYQCAGWIAGQSQARSKSNLKTTLGVSGSQGSGKSTFSALLSNLLRDVFSISAVVLSLDDFYLTRAEREALVEVSPMLKTRGVPGTHDLALAIAARNQFINGDVMRVPEFSKSEDDRIGYNDLATKDTTLLIFEGWCWGAKPEALETLVAPINELERQADADGVWRRFVNEQLDAYQQLFSTDLSLFLKVPDFSCVARWRWQQEQGLPAGPGRMTQAEVERFVMYYERITRQLLRDYAAEATICLSLEQDHSIHLEKFPGT